MPKTKSRPRSISPTSLVRATCCARSSKREPSSILRPGLLAKPPAATPVENSAVDRVRTNSFRGLCETRSTSHQPAAEPPAPKLVTPASVAALRPPAVVVIPPKAPVIPPAPPHPRLPFSRRPADSAPPAVAIPPRVTTPAPPVASIPPGQRLRRKGYIFRARRAYRSSRPPSGNAAAAHDHAADRPAARLQGPMCRHPGSARRRALSPAPGRPVPGQPIFQRTARPQVRPEQRVHRCVPASAVPCIPLASRPQERVRSAWPRCRSYPPPGPSRPGAGQELRRAAPVKDMCRVV